MSFNVANSWQKHTPGNLNIRVHHTSSYIFALYLVKTGKDFHGIQHKRQTWSRSPHKRNINSNTKKDG